MAGRKKISNIECSISNVQFFSLCLNQDSQDERIFRIKDHVWKSWEFLNSVNPASEKKQGGEQPQEAIGHGSTIRLDGGQAPAPARRIPPQGVGHPGVVVPSEFHWQAGWIW
jgi:hypothetical protein